MMKNITFLLSLLFMIYSQSAFAHGGGHGPVSETRAIDIASFTVNQFIHFDAGLGFGKLNKSWKDVSTDEKRIHKKGDGYYIVSTTNKKEGKALYILMSVAGEVYDANFSGEFPRLK
jgi:hypothetical protein